MSCRPFAADLSGDTDTCPPQGPAGGGLLDTDAFPPRWHCGDWTPAHGWLHIVSDLATFAAYVVIPFGLIWFLRSRRDLPFKGLFGLFGAFIVLCGLTHLLEAVMFWWPAYRLMGLVKLLTALVSIATVIALLPTIPKAIRLPSPQQLRNEIDQRKAAEASVKEQVAKLKRTNLELDRFAYAASHDLKAPLRAIGSLASFIAEDLGDDLPEQTVRHLNEMQDRTQRLQDLLSDLLEYARASALTHGVEQIDTGALVKEAWSLIAPPHAFSIEVAPDMPVIQGHRAPLRQVFQNLLANSLNHSDRDDGHVQVSWSDDDDDPRMIAFLVV
ncbi:MAG: hypothetical protein KAI24_24035, partial [Planctomycetes bacterium]|nr:hypothetical protein [Planctomycetota bacterium]